VPEKAGVELAEGVAAMGGTAQAAIDQVIALVSSWGLAVLGAVALLIVGRWIAAMTRTGVTRSLERAGTDATLVPFFASGAYYLVLGVVLIAVLNLFGIETTSLIAVLGAAGLAVGLALQGSLSNFAAGVMLLIFRPIRVGDFVEVAGQAGGVAEIGIFSTTLNTGDNIRIIVPNSAVFGDTIKNYSANDTRRNDMVVGVSYDDDIGKALETINAVLAGESRVLKDPAALVAVAEMADSSVNIIVRPWCKKEDYWGLRFDLTRAFKERLEAAGCSIPYPQHDVHVVGGAS